MPLPRRGPKASPKLSRLGDLDLKSLNPEEDSVGERAVDHRAAEDLRCTKRSPKPEFLKGAAAELQAIRSARIQEDMPQMVRSIIQSDVQDIVALHHNTIQELCGELRDMKSFLRLHQSYLEKLIVRTDPFEALACFKSTSSHCESAKQAESDNSGWGDSSSQLCKQSENDNDSGAQAPEGERPASQGEKQKSTTSDPSSQLLSAAAPPPNLPAGPEMVARSTSESLRKQSRSSSHENMVKMFEKSIKAKNGVGRFINKDDQLEHAFVSSTAFTAGVSLVILLNTIFIGYETHERAVRAWQSPDEEAPTFFYIVNITFTVIFTLELLIRLIVMRWWFFFTDDWKWNVFDLFLVVTSIAQECLESVNIGFIKVVRVFRIIRVARIIRVLRFFRELRHMVFTIIQSLASLAWAFLLLTLITYVFAIFVMSGTSEYIETNGPANNNSRVLQTFFGDLTSSMYSLIHAISGGEDWGPMATALSEQNELYRLAFVAYIVFVVFGVLNVLTGVFCSNGGAMLDKDLIIHSELLRQRQFVREMMAIFKELDPDGDGHFTWEDFEKLLQDPNLQAYFNANDLDPTDAHLLFQMLDHNNSKEVQTLDFIVGCFKLKGAAKSIHVMKMAQDVEKLGQQVSHLYKASTLEKCLQRALVGS